MNLPEEIERLEMLLRRGFLTADELATQKCGLTQANVEGTLSVDQLTGLSLVGLADAVQAGNMTRKDFDRRKGDLLWNETGEDSNTTALRCDTCLRKLAASEIMSFNTVAAKRAGLNVLCPACGDGPSRRRIFGRAPDFYIVSVPDQESLDRSVQSYVAHEWKIYGRTEGAIYMKKKRRQIAIEITLETTPVGEAALLALRKKK